jgi:hypothetical protein
MSLFKIVKGQVVLDMDIIANTPQYANLYESDKSEGKEDAIAKFRLIFHMCDPRSQYSTALSATRFTKIIHDLFPNLLEWEKQGQTGKGADKPYLSALNLYRNGLGLIPEQALLTAAQDAVHDLAERISAPPKTVKRTEKVDDGKGGLKSITVSEEVGEDKATLLGKMAKAAKDLSEVRDYVKQLQEKADQVKGSHALKRREDPDYIHNRES